MAGDWLLSVSLAASALLIALGVWLVLLDPHSRVVRIFVVFLVARAGVSAVAGLRGVFPDWLSDEAAARVVPYYDILTVGALLAFLLAEASRPWVALWGPRLAWLGVAAAEAIYALDHCASLCTAPDGTIARGPISLIDSALSLVAATGGALMIGRSLRKEPGLARTSLVIVAAALLSIGAADGAFFATTWVLRPAAVFATSSPVLDVLAAAEPVVGALVAAFACIRTLRVGPGKAANRVALLVAGAALTGSAAAFFAAAGQRDPPALILATWRVLLPLLVSYALLRYRLFGIDLRARRTLIRALVGGLVVFTFFAATEGGSQLIGAELGPTIGIVAAVVLALAFRPLKVATSRAIERSFGTATPTQGLPHMERLRVYEDLAARAWRTGSLPRKERAFLDSVRVELQLTHEEAASIESKIATPGPSGSDPIEVSHDRHA